MSSTVLLDIAYDKQQVNNCLSATKSELDKWIEDYTQFANDFLQKEYNLTLIVPIKIDGRLKRALGSFHSTRASLPICIKLNKTQVILDRRLETEYIFDTLRHELVHYALFMLGRNYHDGDDDFESELARLNIAASGSTSKNKVLSDTTNQYYHASDLYTIYSKKNNMQIGTTIESHTVEPLAKYDSNRDLSYQEIPCYLKRTRFLIVRRANSI